MHDKQVFWTNHLTVIIGKNLLNEEFILLEAGLCHSSSLPCSPPSIQMCFWMCTVPAVSFISIPANFTLGKLMGLIIISCLIMMSRASK